MGSDFPLEVLHSSWEYSIPRQRHRQWSQGLGGSPSLNLYSFLHRKDLGLEDEEQSKLKS